MAARKTKTAVALTTIKKINSKRIVNILFDVYKTLREILIVVFLIIWIVVGSFFIWFISANFQHGAFKDLMTKPVSPVVSEEMSPQEVDLPGIGKVNVSCVQGSLKEESIVKVIQEGSNASLTVEEKAALEKCKVADPTTPAPPATPAN